MSINTFFGTNDNAWMYFKNGIKKYLHLVKEHTGTGGTNSARYCYSVWLRHLIYLNKNYNISAIPEKIIEIGPGDSIGIGLAALICGTDFYTAMDSIRHNNNDLNLKILIELGDLFSKKENIPGSNEFPNVRPLIEDYSFPDFLREILCNVNIDERIVEIKQVLNNDKGGIIKINYISPWNFENVYESGNADLIYSQAVMEHLENPEEAYKLFYLWLKDGGLISHTIDYDSHGTHNLWNGHWGYNNLFWKILMKGYGYSINRKPHSYHAKLISEKFTDIFELNENNNTGLKYYKSTKFKSYSESDFEIKTSFIQARK